MLLPAMLTFEGLPTELTVRNGIGLTWLAIIGTGLAYGDGNCFRGIALLPVATTSLLVLLSPLVATLLGWLALDQTLAPTQIVGAALVAAAVVSPRLRTRVDPPSPRPTQNDTNESAGSARQICRGRYPARRSQCSV